MRPPRYEAALQRRREAVLGELPPGAAVKINAVCAFLGRDIADLDSHEARSLCTLFHSISGAANRTPQKRIERTRLLIQEAWTTDRAEFSKSSSYSAEQARAYLAAVDELRKVVDGLYRSGLRLVADAEERQPAAEKRGG